VSSKLTKLQVTCIPAYKVGLSGNGTGKDKQDLSHHCATSQHMIHHVSHDPV